MRTGLVASAIAHSVLIGIGLMGLNAVKPLDPQEIEAISVDLVPIETLASIRVGNEQSQVIDTPAPAVADSPKPAELAERTGTTEKDQPEPEQTARVTPAPTIQTAPEPVIRPAPNPKPAPEPEPAPQPQAAPVPDPVIPEPVLATQAESVEPSEIVPQPVTRTASLETLRKAFKAQQVKDKKRKQAEQKAREAENAREADRVADIINAEKSRGATTGTGGQSSAGKATGQAARLSQSELGALIAQMRNCWNPTLAERSDGVVVRLLVAMNQDGSVRGTPQILNQINSSLIGLSSRAAQRKVRACGPFRLPADKYEQWREIDVTLDASKAN